MIAWKVIRTFVSMLSICLLCAVVWYRISSTSLKNFSPKYSIAQNESKTMNRDIVNGQNDEKIISQMIKSSEQLLFSSIKILCLVMNRPSEDGLKKRKAILDTWGPKCTRLIFVLGNAKNDSHVQLTENSFAVTLAVSDKYANLWMKLRSALSYVHKNLRMDFDWFMRMDDDTYIFLDNLRLFLSRHNKDFPIQFGCHFINIYGNYITTGPGIVLSKAAYIILMENFYNDSLCSTNKVTSGDDIQLGRCLRNMNVSFGKSTDSNGKPLFLHLAWRQMLLVNDKSRVNDEEFNKLKNMSSYAIERGAECCSPETIGMHYVTAEEIRLFHFLIYKVRPFYNPSNSIE